jgi:hypothetical protein
VAWDRKPVRELRTMDGEENEGHDDVLLSIPSVTQDGEMRSLRMRPFSSCSHEQLEPRVLSRLVERLASTEAPAVAVPLNAVLLPAKSRLYRAEPSMGWLFVKTFPRSQRHECGSRIPPSIPRPPTPNENEDRDEDEPSRASRRRRHAPTR